MSDEIPVSQVIDATGQPCPLPLLKAKQGLKSLAKGDVLKVIATDPGSVRDFKVFAELSGNRLLYSAEQDQCFVYLLEKA